MPSQFNDSGYPLSFAHVQKFTGGGPKKDFFDFYATRDRVHFFDDFLVDTINLDNYALANGATATAFAHSANPNGMIRGVSGTTAATSGLQIYTPATWYGDQNCGIEVRVRNSVITEQRLEIGFADAVPAVNTLITSNLSTPTYNSAADLALYVQDETGGSTTSGFYTDGTSITAAKTATTTDRFAANTWYTVRIQVVGNKAYLWINGRLVVSHNTAGTDYIEGGNAMRAVVSSKRANTTDSNVDIDYIRIWQDRV